MRTDHKGFVLPAGNKLKSVCHKLQIHNCREHCKQAVYKALVSEDWSIVLVAGNIDVAVNLIEDKITTLMDKCMLFKCI